MNKGNIFQFIGIMEVMGDSFFEANLLKFYRSIRNGLSHSKVSVKAGEACEVSHEQKEKP